MRTRVAVTGIGLRTPAGNHLKTVLDTLNAGVSVAAHVPERLADVSGTIAARRVTDAVRVLPGTSRAVTVRAVLAPGRIEAYQ